MGKWYHKSSLRLLICLVVFSAPQKSAGGGKGKSGPVYSLSDLIKIPEHKNAAMKVFNGSLVYEYWLVANSSRMVPGQEHGQEPQERTAWVDHIALGQVVGLPKCTAFASNRSALHLRLGDAFNENKSKRLWNMAIIPPQELVAALPDDELFTVASGIHNEAYKGRDKTHPEKTQQYLREVMRLLPHGSTVQFRPHSSENVDEDFCTFVHADRFYMSVGGYSERAAEARCALRRETMRFVLTQDGHKLEKYNCTQWVRPGARCGTPVERNITDAASAEDTRGLESEQKAIIDRRRVGNVSID